MPAGRPPALQMDDETLGIVEDHAARGLTQQQIATAMGISDTTLQKYKTEFPQFAAAIKRGQAQGIAKVSNALFDRAVGMEVQDTKVMQYQGEPILVEIKKVLPPDVTAAIFFLKNRAPEEWKDRVPEGIGSEQPTPVKVTFEELPSE